MLHKLYIKNPLFLKKKDQVLKDSMQADFNWNASKWETAGFVTFCCISNVRNAIFIIIIIYFFLHNFNSLLSSDKVLFFTEGHI